MHRKLIEILWENDIMGEFVPDFNDSVREERGAIIEIEGGLCDFCTVRLSRQSTGSKVE